MDRAEVELTVRERVAARLEVGPETLDPSADVVADLGADSLVLVELAADLEDAFDVRLLEDAGTLRTVEAWVGAVLARRG